jgi:membrane protein DedA with SNARE-associated domain
MAQHLFELLRGYLAHYGYWAVAAALLLENAGLPVPGETILLLASFLAYSEHRLHLPYVILIGICAATLGDNLGFLLGHYGGRPLLNRYSKVLGVKPETIARGEGLFARHGAATIFVARFIAGMRVIAGPLAGVLRMHWRKFVVFNFLGAALWVTTISCVGYFFGHHWQEVVRIVRGVNITFLVAAAVLVVVWWWRNRNSANANSR